MLLVGSGGCTSDPLAVVFDAVHAAETGDRPGYLACFTPRSRAVLKAYWTATQATRPTLANLTARAVQVGSTVRGLAPGDRGETRVLVRIEEGERTLGLVLHAVAAAWRIDLLDTEREATMAGLRGAFPGH